ncbi:MAG: FecR domain-containing protein [Magnetococcales bacterium]|nr:FecR domain-containing protein [Magnetococcales bacterium]
MNLMKLWRVWMAGALLLVGAASEGVAAEPIGQIKTASGEVAIERAGQRSSAKVGDSLYQSDGVSTGKESAAGITFVDNSMFSLGPNSHLALEKFRFNTTTHEGVFESSMKKGTLHVKSGKIVKQTPEAMTIKTPTSVLAVRGTEFDVRVDQ